MVGEDKMPSGLHSAPTVSSTYSSSTNLLRKQSYYLGSLRDIGIHSFLTNVLSVSPSELNDPTEAEPITDTSFGSSRLRLQPRLLRRIPNSSGFRNYSVDMVKLLELTVRTMHCSYVHIFRLQLKPVNGIHSDRR